MVWCPLFADGSFVLLPSLTENVHCMAVGWDDHRENRADSTEPVDGIVCTVLVLIALAVHLWADACRNVNIACYVFGHLVGGCFTCDAWPLLVGQRNLYIHCSNVRWLAVVSLVVQGAFDSLNCIVHAL